MIHQYYRDLTPRLLTLLAIVTFIFGSLAFRLWHEQVRFGDDHREAIRKQSIRRIRLPAVRGRLFSSDGSRFGDNVPSHDVFFHIHEMRKPGQSRRARTWSHVRETVATIEQQLGRPPELAPGELKQRVRELPPRRALRIYTVSAQEVVNISDHIKRMDGVSLHVDGSRRTIHIVLAELPIVAGASAQTTLLTLKQYLHPVAAALGRPIELDMERFDDHVAAMRRASVQLYRLRADEKPVASRLTTGIRGLDVESRNGQTVLVVNLLVLQQPYRSGRGETAAYVRREIERTASIIGRDSAISEAQIVRHMRNSPALPFPAFKGLTDGELARLLERMPGMPGMVIETNVERIYPHGGVGAHLIGYVERRSPEEDPESKDYSYFLPELRGRRGLERVVDENCRGRGGTRLVRVDSTGFFHEDVALPELPVAGDDVYLTLDSRAQRIAQDEMRGYRGALVVLDVTNGAVLAMVSSPTFELNEFRSRYRELSRDPALPLFNRALAPGYAPGSIIKPLVALAALSNGVITATDTVECNGYATVGNSRIHCAVRSGHGVLDVAEALEVSCNPFFIRTGLALGIDHLELLLRDAGIGRQTGFELRPNARGIRPGRAQLYRRHRRRWNAFETGLVSIGQGFISLSPLHAAVYTAAIANGGTVYRPHLVRSVRDVEGTYLRATTPEIRSTLDIAAEHLDHVRMGMHRVVHGENATAPAARTATIDLAGKTGTAQIGGGRRNTWFICFGPYDSPRYALAVLVEDGESGGRTAAPIARRFFDRYLAVLPPSIAHSTVNGGDNWP